MEVQYFNQSCNDSMHYTAVLFLIKKMLTYAEFISLGECTWPFKPVSTNQSEFCTRNTYWQTFMIAKEPLLLPKARCYRLHIKNWENIHWDVQEQESDRLWVVLSSPEPRQTKFCKMEEQPGNFISEKPPCSFLCSLQMIVSWVVLLGLKFNINIRHIPQAAPICNVHV